MFRGNRRFQCLELDTAGVAAVTFWGDPVILVEVVAEHAKHDDLCADRFDLENQVVEVVTPLSYGTFVLPPVIGAEGDHDDVGSMREHIRL